MVEHRGVESRLFSAAVSARTGDEGQELVVF